MISFKKTWRSRIVFKQPTVRMWRFFVCAAAKYLTTLHLCATPQAPISHSHITRMLELGLLAGDSSSKGAGNSNGIDRGGNGNGNSGDSGGGGGHGHDALVGGGSGGGGGCYGNGCCGGGSSGGGYGGGGDGGCYGGGGGCCGGDGCAQTSSAGSGSGASTSAPLSGSLPGPTTITSESVIPKSPLMTSDEVEAKLDRYQ